MNELIKIPHGDPQRTGLVIPDGIAEDEWKSIGHQLCKCKDSVNFWIGDWLNYGNAAYGEKYKTAMEIFRAEGTAGYGLEEGTLRNVASVARRIPLSLRRDKLSFKHHTIIADNFTDEKDKDLWLSKAVVGEFSTAQLTEEIRGKSKSKSSESTNSTAHFFIFDAWINEGLRGFKSFPIAEMDDEELSRRIKQIDQLRAPLLEAAKERGLEVG